MFGFCDSCLEKFKQDIEPIDFEYKKTVFLDGFSQKYLNAGDKVVVYEDKKTEDCSKFKTQVDSDNYIFFLMLLPNVVLMDPQSKFSGYERLNEFLLKVICFNLFGLMNDSSTEQQLLSDGKFYKISEFYLLQGVKDIKSFIFVSVYNKEVMCLSTNLFNSKNSQTSEFVLELEYIMVHSSFRGWILYIKISGKKCSEIKYLRISFDDGHMSADKKLNFKKINNVNSKLDDVNNLVLIDQIWMIRENKQVEKSNDLKVKWLYKKGLNVFKQYDKDKDISRLPQCFCVRRKN